MKEQPKKVLVIEDRQSVSYMIEILLTHKGYQVCKTGNGEAGLMKVKYCCFDAIVLDLMIEGLNGWGVLAKMSQEERDKTVVVSGYIDENARHFNANSYIEKPFSANDISEAIEKIIHG